jgi:hypothetical protein
MTTKKTTAKDTVDPQPSGETLAGMPPEPPKKSKRAETLFVAYALAPAPAAGESTDFHDVCVFGTKLGALEFAMEQEPAWKVTEAAKGHPLRGVVGL